jgi:hypothetical protein
MINLALSLLIGAAAAALILIKFSWVAAIAPFLIAGLVAYVMLSRKVAAKLEETNAEIEKALSAGRTDQALKLLEGLRPLGKKQFGVEGALDAEIGIIQYAHKKAFDAAQPYLEKAPNRAWQARAMLGAVYYRKKRYDDMVKVFEELVASRAGKKASLAWGAYAWCEWKRGEAEAAKKVLQRGLKEMPKDAKLQANLESLEAGKKPKMKGYATEWLAFHLEPPPAMAQAAKGQGWLPPGALPRGKRRR